MKIDEDLKKRVECWWQRPFSDFIGLSESPEFNFTIIHYAHCSILEIDITNNCNKGTHRFVIPVGMRHHSQVYNIVITDFLLSLFRPEKYNRSCAEYKKFKKLSEEEYTDFICEHG